MLQNKYDGEASYIISQYIEDVQFTLVCCFYVTKSARIIWIGAQECDLREYDYAAGIIDWDLQEQYKRRVYDKFLVPIANYLHGKGYFGVVGLDIVTGPSGDFLVDLNPRINGGTSCTMLASNMAHMGLTKSLFQICARFDVSGERLVQQADAINEEKTGRIVIVAAADDGEMRCYATVSVFADNMKMVESLYAKLG